VAGRIGVRTFYPARETAQGTPALPSLTAPAASS